MEEQEDSVREDPDPPTPAQIAEQIEEAEKRRLLSQANASPLTRAVQARNANHISHPDAAMLKEMQFRRCPAPPLDILGAPDGEYMSEAVQKACQMLYDMWKNVHEAAQDRNVSREQLSRAGQRVLNVALTPLNDCRVELEKGVAEAQRKIDTAVMRPVDSALAQDIRRAFVERKGAIHDSVRRDWRVASAILNAPIIVLGTTDEKMGQYRDIAEQAHAPEHLERKRRLHKLQLHVQRAATLAVQRLQPALTRWTDKQNPALQRLLAS